MSTCQPPEQLSKMLIQSPRKMTGSWVTWTGAGFAPDAPVTLLDDPASTYAHPTVAVRSSTSAYARYAWIVLRVR